MLVFLDFEASSLARKSYPIEVAWIFEGGRSESHLIRPAPDWTDWAEDAEAIHGLSRQTLARDGVSHEIVARRMLDVLGGEDLYASAPSWDGKWLSVLLRAAGLPRHALRLNDTEEARARAVRDVFASRPAGADDEAATARILADVADLASRATPDHRALGDASRERDLWQEARKRAEAVVGLAGLGPKA